LSKTLIFWLEGQVLINNNQSLIESIKNIAKPYKYLGELGERKREKTGEKSRRESKKKET